MRNTIRMNSAAIREKMMPTTTLAIADSSIINPPNGLTAIAASPSTVYVAAPQGVLQYSASAPESQQTWSEVPGFMLGGAAPVLPG